jgi:hypothetical protein
MLSVRARRLVSLLAALTALVLAGCGGVTTTPALHAVGAQNRVGPFIVGPSTLTRLSVSESACSRLGSAVSGPEVVAGFCVATEGVDIGGASFAQKTFGEAFSSGGRFAGRTIDQVTGDLRSGAMSPSDVPIEVINRGGNSLILNTRSAQALMRAGIPRSEWDVVNMTGNSAAEARLSGQLARNGLGDSGYGSPTPSGG